MLTAALLLAGQVAAATPDTSYQLSPLAKLVAAASAANRVVPPALAGYEAMIESEVAVLINTPTGPDGAVAGTAAATTELAAQIEQFQLSAAWSRDGSFRPRVVGYRARQLSPMVSAMTILPRPWTAPALYGDRLSLVFGGQPSFRSGDTTRTPIPAVHPFAEDRDEYYTFAGGDTAATMTVGTRTLHVVRIVVEPRAVRRGVMLFAGEVMVDGATGAIVRMRGRIRTVSPPGLSPAERLVRFVGQVQEVAYIDFENAEYDAQFWLPRKQRLEYQVLTGLTEARATIRVQSVWRAVNVGLRQGATASAGDTLGPRRYGMEMAPGDSASQWSSWRNDIGVLTADASARDFDDVAPPEFRPSGPPRWRWQARGFTDVLRLNRVEGLFLGASGLLDLRQSSPGTTVRMFGGWAFGPGSAKGGLEAAKVHGAWVTNLRAERQLASTNDLSMALGLGGGNALGALFGREDYDWVDRRILSLGLTRELGTRHASSVRAELGVASDRRFSDEMADGPIAGEFRPNRPIDAGRYVRSRVRLDLGRNIITSPLASGVGTTVEYERGDGDLDWQRAQLQILAQRMIGRLALAARARSAVVLGDEIPTQQVLEVGGVEGLPGYDYKEFAGDRAVVVGSTATYLLPLWERPIHVWRLVLPAFAPQLQVGYFTGSTSVSRDNQAVLNRQGWVTTDGWRGSFDARLRVFSGAFSIGASRAVDRRDRWKAVIGVGGAL